MSYWLDYILDLQTETRYLNVLREDVDDLVQESKDTGAFIVTLSSEDIPDLLAYRVFVELTDYGKLLLSLREL